MKRRILLPLCLGALLTVAIVAAVYIPSTHSAEPSLKTPLTEILPSAVAGWQVKDLPIAETEEMRKAVGEILNYDDAVYREYSKGNLKISIYIAYWRPGKMSSRLVAGHSPDVCWIATGWKCVARSEWPNIETASGLLPTAQAGVYRIADTDVHVLFWHIYDQEAIKYNTAGRPPWWSTFRDIATRGLNQRAEQLFIRISSNVPFDEFDFQNTTIPSGLRELIPTTSRRLAHEKS